MFRILIIFFILVPIVEIAVFIQVGDLLGSGLTILIVVITAVLGVNLLKRQGFRAWHDIQQSIVAGKVPAIEMASAAQLLFAGGLLLTPGFVTDSIGFLLMVPQIRRLIATKIIQQGFVKTSSYSSSTSQNSYFDLDDSNKSSQTDQTKGRIIEGEFEEKD